MATSSSTHEHQVHSAPVQAGSERSFGLIFAAFFVIVAAWPLLKGGEARWWAFGVAGVFLAFALAWPKALRPLNHLWFKVGLVLHAIVNPLVLGLMFFVVITPIALLMRALGKDPLKMKLDATADSYWIVREPPGPAPESMKNQF